MAAEKLGQIEEDISRKRMFASKEVK